ncbi:TPA: hypothetical protein JHK28_000141 [Enterobacter cloacae]|nr:hypothetical protein [Enterobacter cloacae]
MADKTFDIAQLFEGRLAEFASSQAISVAWENLPFKPSDDVYLRVFLLPADTGIFDVQGKAAIYRGIFQVNVVSPAGAGVTEARRIAASIAGWFPCDMKISDGKTFAYINGPPTTHAPIQGDTDFAIPISINYHSA